MYIYSVYFKNEKETEETKYRKCTEIKVDKFF